MGSFRCCLCFTREFKAREENPPEDVRAAFAAFASVSSAQMDAAGLQKFLDECQREPGADAERLMERIQASRRSGSLLAKPMPRSFLSLRDFYGFLFSVHLNPPLPSSQVHHDMTSPMSHYFIYTGHNSYLTGNQLSSDCSDIPIIKALQKGVRVIELDIWPNSRKDNVDVLHGRTLTSPVNLLKCLRSIKEYAFCASSYPLIITLEDHLSPDLQAKVARMVTETFGDMLFTPEAESLAEFPSPESLMKRIILSTKPPKEYLESKTSQDTKDDSGKRKNQSESEDESTGKDEEDVHVDDVDDIEDGFDGNLRKDSAPEYKRLITITAGKPKGHLKEALKVDPSKVQRLSLSEQQLKKASATYGTDIVRFTQKNLLRIYPKGTRLNSSNYNPMIGWTHGAQMVAFNMQGYGKSLWLMEGFFRASGGSGYVKKPDFLLKVGPHGEVFDPKRALPVKKTLKVKVCMGDGWRLDFKQTHFDAYSPPDFFTRIGIAGVPADMVMKKTRIIENDWVPVWDEEFIFPLSVPELALLRIEVHEYDTSEKDDFGGQNCLPVMELRPGIRAVPLFNRKGVQYKSVRLLLRFDFI